MERMEGRKGGREEGRKEYDDDDDDDDDDGDDDDDDDDDDVIAQPHYPPYWTYMSVNHLRGNFLKMHRENQTHWHRSSRSKLEDLGMFGLT